MSGAGRVNPLTATDEFVTVVMKNENTAEAFKKFEDFFVRNPVPEAGSSEEYHRYYTQLFRARRALVTSVFKQGVATEEKMNNASRELDAAFGQEEELGGPAPQVQQKVEPQEKKVLAPKASPPAKVSRRRVKPTRSSSSEGESRNVSPPRAKASRKSVVRTMSAKSAVPDDAGHSYKLRPRSGEARVYKDDSDTADEKEKVAMPLSEERRSQLKAQKQKRVKQEDIIVLDD